MGSYDAGSIQMFSARKRSEQTFEPPTIACVYSSSSQTLTRVSFTLRLLILKTVKQYYSLKKVKMIELKKPNIPSVC